MGFFDSLFGGKESKIDKHGRKLRNKDTPVEEREAAAYWLADEATPEAILALLGRFEMTYEHHMKDQAEKKLVQRLVLELGERALEPLQIFLRKSSNFARPMALYEKIAGREASEKLLLEMLETELAKSGLKPKKKNDLLVKAAEYKSPAVAESAARFLDDFDEGCRYAAAEVLLAQDETPEIRQQLLERIADEDEDSGRMRHRVCEVAAGRGWDLGDFEKGVAATVPQDFTVKGGRVVTA